MDNLEPITRNEMFLNGDDLEPITREEMILAGEDLEPITRHEWFLKKYRGGGGGGGYDLVNIPDLPADIASFNDGTDLPMASLKVAVTPYQDLSHGDPSPENICPIIGWDEAVVTVADDAESPTTSHEYTIDLDGTRYGGPLDVVSGVLTVDRASITVDENSNIILGSGGLPFRIDLLTGAKASSSASALTGVKCNFLKEVTQSSSWGVDGTFSRVTTSANIVYFKVNSEITTTQQLKTFLQSNNLQFVYELATPQTIQLTPTQVKSLLGSNNVWADTGEIEELEYFSKDV